MMIAEEMNERDIFYYQKGYDKAIDCATYWAKKSNKMPIVAAQFGKRLGEEFTVKYQISKYKWCIVDNLVFTDRGLTYYGKCKDTILRQLLTGQAVIVDE